MSWKGVDEINFVHTRFLFDAKPKYQCNSGGGEKKKLIALNKIQEILLTKSLNKPNKYIKTWTAIMFQIKQLLSLLNIAYPI